jgi:hypothetical protein
VYAYPEVAQSCLIRSILDIVHCLASKQRRRPLFNASLCLPRAGARDFYRDFYPERSRRAFAKSPTRRGAFNDAPCEFVISRNATIRGTIHYARLMRDIRIDINNICHVLGF